MTQAGLLVPTASGLGPLTCVFDSELDGEIVRPVANHADSVLDETILGRLPVLPKKVIRCDENNLQRRRKKAIYTMLGLRVSVEGSGGMGKGDN